MKKLCIIPARGGSKRIPRKNIRSFLGKPIIAYSIEAALDSALFDEVMVSTDDNEIAELAKAHGAKIPFIRSSSTSNDYSSTVDVLTEVLDLYDDSGMSFEYGCCIYPTAPFLSGEKIKEGYNVLRNFGYDTLFPVVRFSFPLQRALKLKDGKISMFHPDNLNVRSQDLEPAYHDAGQFYWFNVNALRKHCKLVTDNSGAIILDEIHVQDIDHESDWAMAELKYKMLNG